jgi:hypothetical protein
MCVLAARRGLWRPYMPALTWKLNKSIAFGPKILRSERERFCSIMNFVSKTNIFDFLGDISRKTKANDHLKNVGLTLLFKQYIAYKYV